MREAIYGGRKHGGMAHAGHGSTLKDALYAGLGQILRSAPDQSLAAAWRPNPPKEPGGWSPQQVAFECEADETAYGGRAGGGKTSWLVGTALIGHHKSVIFRRQYTEFAEIDAQVQDIVGNLGSYSSSTKSWRLPMGKRLIYGACQHERDRDTWQGNPHDFYGFDELTSWPESLYVYLCGWNRTSRLGQRCRICATFNPPSNAEGQWVIDRFGPWIDPGHPHPAAPGELRYFVRVKGRDVEVQPRFCAEIDGKVVFSDEVEPERVTRATGRLPRIDGAKAKPCEVIIDGESYLPASRTFIPAGMDDNPFIGPEYRSKIDAMPEPLRSQLKYGDFGLGRQDDPWQVIPSAWVDEAMARWKRRTVDLGVAGVRRPADCAVLSQLGVDVARDGSDEALIVSRYGNWFSFAQAVEKDESRPTGYKRTGGDIGRRILLAVDKDSAPVIMVDLINVGTSVVDWLYENDVDGVVPFVASAKSAPHRTTSGGLAFYNDRAVALWNMRELLDPENGFDVMLPPSSKLRADLCAPRFEIRAGKILIEDKDAIKERLGRSTDTGDATCLAALESLVPSLAF